MDLDILDYALLQHLVFFGRFLTIYIILCIYPLKCRKLTVPALILAESL